MTYVHEIANDERPALLWRSAFLWLQQIKLPSERQEVCKQRVEMSFCTQMQVDGIVGVIEMGEDAQELSIDVSSDGWEIWREFSSCFRREHGFVFDETFDPCQNVVDVLRCWKFDSFSVRVDPSVIHSETNREAV